ncbi:MAG: discoidin domain-containing protein [Prevotella sp.]|nr:discoidin domain-containing protein [Prevotella sp.]
MANIKKAAFIIAALTALGGQAMAQEDTYTKGIGIYPGKTSESFAPQWTPDTHYRNIALHRKAYHSSSYDYNLTAQLITDGIITHRQPAYITVSTPHGELPKREREWSIDGGEYTRNILIGEETYLRYDWHEMNTHANRLKITMQVAYRRELATQGYEIVCMTSKDGKKWKEIGAERGEGLPGKALSHTVHSDPNKVTDSEMLPALQVETSINLKTPPFHHLKVLLRMKGAAHWTVTEVKFFANNPKNISSDQYVTNHLPAHHFGSAWMSGGSGKEWVYIDLGAKVRFDLIRLHWIQKATKGFVEMSDDRHQWKPLAPLPGGKRPTDEIACQGNARYVRVLMEQPNSFGRYVLSEMEVMGQGGFLPKAQPLAGFGNTSSNNRNIDRSMGKFMLNGGNWHLQRKSEVTATGEMLSKTGFDDNSWLAATVPATVMMSYVNAGALPNPNYADNLFYISESFFNSNFWYRNEFEVPHEFDGKHVFLNLDGINWKANVYLNGTFINRTEGAFVRGKTDVTHLLHKGKNALAIEIVANAHPGAVKEKNELNTDFNGGILGADNPTFHATVGWDWISSIRGRNMGIWNDVYLTASNGVSLSDPLVTTSLNLPDTLATVTPSVLVTNHENMPVKALLSGWIGNIRFEQTINMPANSTQEVSFSPETFKMLNRQPLQLWWPNGYGTPYLYNAGFTITKEGGQPETIRYKAGIRQVTHEDASTRLKMFINGKRFIPLGGNWGFSENNLSYRGREYDVAVRYHKEMNYNMIRNWVGQTGDEEFYEACDKYGIMVWQDFWLANPADGPDPDDNTMFLNNAEDYVKRIRHHASIGIYCGRNEGYPPAAIDKKLKEYVQTLHPGLAYISSSADDGVSGHGPYWALPAKEYFERQTGKLHSERGMPNVMNYESLKRTLIHTDLWPQSNKWGQHDYTLQGAQRGASFNGLIEKGFGMPKNAKDFTTLAQWINYDGYRAMYESGSRDRMGLLIWMSHPCWPTMVWQTYDYYFEPTAAYFGVKKACEPLHIQWNALTRNVEIVNLCAGHKRNLKVAATLLDMNGKPQWHEEQTADCNNDMTKTCMNIAEPTPETGVYFIQLRLTDADGKPVSENFYIQSTVPDNYQALNKLPKVAPEMATDIRRNGEEWTATVQIENRSSVPAMMLRVNLKGADGEQILPVIYSDNYFHLMPGDQKTVAISWKHEDTRGSKPMVEVTGFNMK